MKLIGFCAEDSNRLLVYEYMSRGSLENHLFRSKFEQGDEKAESSISMQYCCRYEFFWGVIFQKGEMELELYHGKFE